MDIAVVGDINIDCIPNPIPDDVNIREDGQVFVDDLVYRLGGQGANFSVKLAELGRDVSFHGKLGEDRNAAFLMNVLEEKGVRPNITQEPDIKTGTTLVVPWKSGHRHYISHTENNSLLRLDDIDLDAVKEAGHLARRGVWFSRPMLDGGNRELLKYAKDNGIETSIDLHWDPHWNQDGPTADRRRNMFYEALPYANYLMGNEEEIKRLAARENLSEAVDLLRDHGAETIVVHQGPDGSTIFDSGSMSYIDTERIENPVNPTGTGDVYDAGFIHARMRGEQLDEAAAFGTTVALKHLRDELQT